MIFRVVSLLALLVLATEAKKYSPELEQQWEEFQEYLKWKKFQEEKDPVNEEVHNVQINNERTGPPSPDQAALMARYIVNQADWSAVATISTRKDIESFPTANLISFGDGPLGNGSGIPYVYLTPLDFTAQDLAKDHRATFLMSLAQGDYCKDKAMDPMDPRCARVMLSGKIKQIKEDNPEHDIAKKTYFERHPKMANMPANHHFFFAKLKIVSICVLDTFGGPKYVNLKEYLHPPVENIEEEVIRIFPTLKGIATHQMYNPISNHHNPVVHVV